MTVGQSLATLATAGFLSIVGAPALAADTTDFVAELRARGIVDPMEKPPDALLHSTDLRLRIIFSTGPFRRRDDGTYWRDPLVAADTLVEQARGSTDPLVLGLLAMRCGQQPPCDVVDLLRRWTEADRQNQVAWIRLAGVLQARGDLAGARDAFLVASRASVWHEQLDEVARLILAAMPRDVSDDQRLASILWSRSLAAITVPFDELHTLGTFCKQPDATLRDACVRIVATMVRDTVTTMPLTSAPAYAARAGLSDLEVAAYQQKSDAIHWALLQVITTLRSADIATQLAAWERLIASGERVAAERYLVDRHIAERDAAARYTATLTPDQLKHRNELRSAR